MKIGILGGGQLARMLIEENNRYGYEFLVLAKEKDSPAGQVTPHEITGDWNDEECLKKFHESADVITLENEFIDFRKIKLLEDIGAKVYPDSNAVKLIQDKFIQKKTLTEINIPVAEFAEVETKNDILNFASENSYPLILKSRTMGYDGKGNFKINAESEIENAFETLSRRGKLMCERFVKFDKEIATQAARNKKGEIKIYPVVETIQKDHICHLVISASNLFLDIAGKVDKIARKIVSELNYVGVMGIEMFLIGDTIFVNELAPRVHNSGHYTIEGCYSSQFENHIRAINNQPLGSVDMREKSAVMINILGERDGDADFEINPEILSMEKVYLHNYGKRKSKAGRKMGHITVLGNELETTIRTAIECRREIKI